MRVTPEMILNAKDETEWLINGVLPLGIQITLYGKPGLGKSILAMQWALDVAKEQPVVYLDYEGSTKLMLGRMKQFERYDEYATNLHYMLGAHGDIGFLDTKDGANRLEEMLLDTGARVLFIDSIAEATTGRENDSDTFTAFNHHTGRILKLNDVTTIRIDHESTKAEGNGGPRGSSRKTDDTELEWKVTTINQNSGVIALRRGKDRGGYINDDVTYWIKRDPSRVTLAGETTIDVATDHELELHQQLDMDGFDLAHASRKTLNEHLQETTGKGVKNETASRLIRQAKAQVLEDPYGT